MRTSAVSRQLSAGSSQQAALSFQLSAFSFQLSAFSFQLDLSANAPDLEDPNVTPTVFRGSGLQPPHNGGQVLNLTSRRGGFQTPWPSGRPPRPPINPKRPVPLRVPARLWREVLVP